MLLLGNLITLVGCGLMVGIGLIKEKKKILAVQCVQFGFLAAGNLCLGGVTGFIANLVSLLRNLAFARGKTFRGMKWGFIALQLLLSLCTIGENAGIWYFWMPILAAAIFTWFLDTKSEIRLKVVIILTQGLWLMYDLGIRNYVAVVFDVFTMLSTAIGIGLIRKKQRQEAGKF